MDREAMTAFVRDLPKDRHVNVYKDKEVEISLFRPSKLPSRMDPEKYNVDKNFQIWLHYLEDGRKFKPNHLRVFVDLGLRSKSRPRLKKKLCLAFDSIYNGQSPTVAISELQKEHFPLKLNRIAVIAHLVQLMVIEQEFNYLGPSKFEPKTLFFQGWIRAFLDSFKEIDNLCMSAARGQPPLVRYTWMENKKHGRYREERPELWYLD